MQPPYYNPPYDSPIEDDFAYHLVKYISELTTLSSQYHVATVCGNFYIDFLLTSETKRKIAIECDGKEFHRGGRDEWRDAMILGSTDIEAIYRIKGKDICWNINNVLYLISKIEPEFFSIKGIKNLKNLADIEFKKHEISPIDTDINIPYENEFVDNRQVLSIIRLHKNIPIGHRQFWQSIYKWVMSVGGGDIDELRNKYHEGI